MDFTHTDKVKALQDRLGAFMEAHVLSNEGRRDAVIEDLKARARAEGLWNLFLRARPTRAAGSRSSWARPIPAIPTGTASSR